MDETEQQEPLDDEDVDLPDDLIEALSGHGFDVRGLALLGALVVECAANEHHAMMSLGSFLELMQDVSNPLLAGESASWVFDKMRQVIPLKLEAGPLRDRWLNWLSEVVAVSQERNKLVHSLWASGADGMVGMQRRRNKTPTLHVFELEKITQLVNKAGRLSGDCMQLFLDTPGFMAE